MKMTSIILSNARADGSVLIWGFVLFLVLPSKTASHQSISLYVPHRVLSGHSSNRFSSEYALGVCQLDRGVELFGLAVRARSPACPSCRCRTLARELPLLRS